MTNEDNPVLAQHAVRSGLLIGALNALFFLMMYVIDATSFMEWKVSLLIFAFNIGLLFYFGIQYRKTKDDIISFGSAFLHGFITLGVAGLLALLSRIFIFHVLDPSLIEVITNQSIEVTVNMLKNFGMSDSEIDSQIEEIIKNTNESLTITGMLKQFGWSLIFFAILSLISGLIIKKDEPI